MVLTMLAPWWPHTHDVRTIVDAGVELALPAELRPAVHRLRVRRVPLDVRLGLGAVEHVVGATRRQTGAPTRRAASATWRVPSALTRKAVSGSASQRVDRGPRRRVHDRVGAGVRRSRRARRRGRRRRARRWSTAMTSCPAAAKRSTSSVPSWPPAPVTRTRTGQPGLQRLPPATVVAVPLDGVARAPRRAMRCRLPAERRRPWRCRPSSGGRGRAVGDVVDAAPRRHRAAPRSLSVSSRLVISLPAPML